VKAHNRSWRAHIETKPEVLGGTPVIRGTRVAVQVVIGSLAGGMSEQEVCEQYRLKPRQIQAALAYAADV